MSNKEVCDQCGKMIDQEKANCWYHVSKQGANDDEWAYVDLCSIECLREWAKTKADYLLSDSQLRGELKPSPKEAEPAKVCPCPCPCPRTIPMPYPIYSPAITWPNEPTRITWHIDTGSTTADNAK